MKKYPQVVQLHANYFYDSPSVRIRSVHTDRLPGRVLEYQKKHATYDELIEVAPDYKYYATVRHPLRRLQSMYRLLTFSKTDGVRWTTLDFNDWVYTLCTTHSMMEKQDILDSSMFHLTQSAMIGESEWHKLEEGTIWNALDIEEKHHYALQGEWLFDEDTKQMAIDYYAEDFDRFNYATEEY